jgi:hypothetical protein
MFDQAAMFPLEPVPERKPESRSMRLRRLQQEAIDAGWHPATGHPLLRGDGAGLTCGQCRLRVFKGRYPKCELHRLGASHSESSDVRAWWPACIKFQRGRAGGGNR